MYSLNVLAGTLSANGQVTCSAARAADIWAGNAGPPFLELIGALNKKNGTVGLEYNAVCNALAGTKDLSAHAALAVAAGLATA